MYTFGFKASVNLRRENVSLSPRKPSYSGENTLNGAPSQPTVSYMEDESE